MTLGMRERGERRGERGKEEVKREFARLRGSLTRSQLTLTLTLCPLILFTLLPSSSAALNVPLRPTPSWLRRRRIFAASFGVFSLATALFLRRSEERGERREKMDEGEEEKDGSAGRNERRGAGARVREKEREGGEGGEE